jgi:hypothetical protein
VPDLEGLLRDVLRRDPADGAASAMHGRGIAAGDLLAVNRHGARDFGIHG